MLPATFQHPVQPLKGRKWDLKRCSSFWCWLLSPYVSQKSLSISGLVPLPVEAGMAWIFGVMVQGAWKSYRGLCGRL